MRCLCWSLFFSLCSTALPEDSIRLPVSKTTPVAPAAVNELNTNEIFVIESDKPAMVLASRAGHLLIVKETGPMRIRGVFSDATNPGKAETRNYTAKFLWLIESAADGEVELLVVPGDSASESDVIRRTLIVKGSLPSPDPPKPNPEPPKPEPKPPVTSFRVIFIKESGVTLDAAQTAIPGAKAVKDYLFAKTTRENNVTGWREYDPDTDATNDQPTMRAMWAKIQPEITTVPCIAIEVNGKVEILPYPANVAEALVLLKKAGG